MFHQRWTTRLTASVLLGVAISVTAPAVAQEDPETTAQTQRADTAHEELRKKVDTLLSGIETAPTATQWRGLGPDAGPILVAIVADEKSRAVRRGNAAVALVHFPTADTTEALRTVLAADGTPKHVRRKAIIALGKIEGDAALDVLAGELEHASKRVRETAIRAVGAIGTRNARALLQERSSTESSKYLRGLIAKELEKPVEPSLVVPTADSVRAPDESGGDE